MPRKWRENTEIVMGGLHEERSGKSEKGTGSTSKIRRKLETVDRGCSERKVRKEKKK